MQRFLICTLAAATLVPVPAAAQIVYTWGDNNNGELGNNSTTDSRVPVAVSTALLNSLTVTKIAAGSLASYALTDTGRLFAWGDNSYGELGLGSATANFVTPQEVIAPNGYYWTNIDADPFSLHVVAAVAPVPEPGPLLLVLGATVGVWRGRRFR